MRYTLKVIAYDIADYKRLCKISSLLLNYGNRVQKSVFECYIDDIQTKTIVNSILRIIDLSKDKVKLYNICKKDNIRVLTRGNQIRQKEYDYFIY